MMNEIEVDGRRLLLGAGINKKGKVWCRPGGIRIGSQISYLPAVKLRA